MSIPSAVTLPYTFKSVPTTLPPSVLAETEGQAKPKYIVSAGGHAGHPDEVVAACEGLREHLRKSKEDAEQKLAEWMEGVKQRDLAEKRRVAPGWLDREEKILEPTKVSGRRGAPNNLLDEPDTTGSNTGSLPSMVPSREGEEIDRAFGKLGVK